MRTRRLSRLPLAALALSALLTACAGPGDTERPLTADEAQRLALARFRTYQTGTAAMDLRVAAPGGTTEVRAVVDHRGHRAVGWYVTDGAPKLLAWSPEGLAVAKRGTYGAPAAKPPTGDALRGGALRADARRVDGVGGPRARRLLGRASDLLPRQMGTER